MICKSIVLLMQTVAVASSCLSCFNLFVGYEPKTALLKDSEVVFLTLLQVTAPQQEQPLLCCLVLWHNFAAG